MEYFAVFWGSTQEINIHVKVILSYCSKNSNNKNDYNNDYSNNNKTKGCPYSSKRERRTKSIFVFLPQPNKRNVRVKENTFTLQENQ